MNVTARALCLALLTLVLAPGLARAQGFVGGSIGSVFGTPLDECGTIATCENRRSSVGFTVGALGRMFGTELEVTHTPKFFGESDILKDQSVTTVVYDVLLKLPNGPVQPYGLVGLGVLHTSVDFERAVFTSLRDSSLVWTVGAGLLVFPGRHVGIRGEVKHFRPTGDFEIPGLSVGSSTLSFSRVSAGLLVRF